MNDNVVTCISLSTPAMLYCTINIFSTSIDFINDNVVIAKYYIESVCFVKTKMNIKVFLIDETFAKMLRVGDLTKSGEGGGQIICEA